MVAYKIELLRLPGPLPQRIDLCALKDREAPVSQALKKTKPKQPLCSLLSCLKTLSGEQWRGRTKMESNVLY